MNAHPLQTDESHASLEKRASENPDRLRDFTGGYYRILGWIDLISSAISLGICYWTGHLAITSLFAICFWLGTCLKRGIPAARRWAIANPIIAGVVFAIAIIFPGLNLRIAPWGIDSNHTAFVPLAVVNLVILAIPGLMLLGDRGRRAFTGRRTIGKPAAGIE